MKQTYYIVVSRSGNPSRSARTGAKLYEVKHAALNRSKFMKESRVAEVDFNDLITADSDLTEQFAHAERMALKYAARMDELQKKMKEGA